MADDRRAGDGRRRRSAGRVGADRVRRPDVALAVTVAVGVGAGILLATVAQGVFLRLRSLVVAVLLSLFLSFAMEPAVQWLSRRGMRRGVATGLVFLAAALAVVGFVAAMMPLVITQVRNLVESGPALTASLADQAARLPAGLGEGISDYLGSASVPTSSVVDRVSGGLLGFGTTVAGAVLQGLTVLLVSFYLVADGPRFRRVVSSWLQPQRQAHLLEVWELAIDKTGGYVYGRVLIAVISAAFHATAFTLIGLDYPLALGVWVGAMSSLIPVVGTYLAGALPLAVALASSPLLAVWVVVAVGVYQQIENYLVAPRITAATMALHPAVAFLAVLAGASLLGAAGALLALPAAAIIGGLVSAAGERHEVVDHDLLGEVAPDVTA